MPARTEVIADVHAAVAAMLPDVMEIRRRIHRRPATVSQLPETEPLEEGLIDREPVTRECAPHQHPLPGLYDR